MRAILLVLILAVIGLIVLVATGLLDISQTRPAEVPAVSVTEEGVSATGGQTPTFDVETGSISVGANEANVTVPVPAIQVNPADGNAAQQASNSAQ
ncbi:MAG: hypothetical protein M3Y43_06645 [Pseudomonadota bacterium]|nr:hypothetical protein [Pseudomonadota bacterium]